MVSTNQSNARGGNPRLLEARVARMNIHMAQGVIRGVSDPARLDAIQDAELGRSGGPRQEVVAALNQRRREIADRDQPCQYTTDRVSRECPACGRRSVLSEYEFRRSVLRVAETDAPGSDLLTWGREFVESDDNYICVSCQWRTRK